MYAHLSHILLFLYESSTPLLHSVSDFECPNLSTYPGWGKTSSGDTADVLQEAEVTVASKYLCMGTMLYEEGEIITDDMLCAAGHRTDACQVKTSVGMFKDFSFSPT